MFKKMLVYVWLALSSPDILWLDLQPMSNFTQYTTMKIMAYNKLLLVSPELI